MHGQKRKHPGGRWHGRDLQGRSGTLRLRPAPGCDPCSFSQFSVSFLWLLVSFNLWIQVPTLFLFSKSWNELWTTLECCFNKVVHFLKMVLITLLFIWKHNLHIQPIFVNNFPVSYCFKHRGIIISCARRYCFRSLIRDLIKKQILPSAWVIVILKGLFC